MKTLLILLLLQLLLFAEKPKLLLLKTYKDQNISNWLMSEKLDGIRGFWDGKQLISRGGKIIHTPSYFTKEFPPFFLDGELWSKRGDFENISSIVRDKKPSKRWKEISFNAFEVPHATGGLLRRLEKVKSYESKVLKIVPQLYVKDKKALQKFLEKVEEKGGEGVVVRNPHAPYINKRTSEALKVKTFKDMECKVVGHTRGKGKNKGMMGAMICELQNGTLFKIGTGFSDEERKYPPKIGEIVTFKYKEFTKYKKPRFPVFLRIRKKI